MPPREGSEVGWSKIPVKRGKGMCDYCSMNYEVVVRTEARLASQPVRVSRLDNSLQRGIYRRKLDRYSSARCGLSLCPATIRLRLPRPAAWLSFSSPAH